MISPHRGERADMIKGPFGASQRMTSPIATLHFDADLLPAKDRFDVWRRGVAAFDVTRSGDTTAPFHAKVDAWTLDSMAITSGRQSAACFVRTHEIAQADAHDGYLFVFLRDGSWSGDAAGVSLIAGPGELIVLDLTRPMTAETTDVDSVTVVVARNAIETAMPEPPAVHGHVLEGAAGRLLAEHLLSLVHHLPAIDEKAASAVIQATVSLIAACFASIGAQDAPRSAASVRHRARTYINQNLTSQDLSAETIGKKLAIGRSALYRAFAPFGGVQAYLRKRRLEAAHALLVDPKESRSITEIAYAFHFVSIPHFSRAFRNRFGYSPRQARHGAGQRPKANLAMGGNGDPAVLGNWVRGLT
jgi:AraC-like DNA-binding protein